MPALKTYSLVMLLKSKYNKEHLILDATPRLLIIKSYTHISCPNKYIVRYPDGATDEITETDVNQRQIIDPDNIRYTDVASHNSAVLEQIKRSEAYCSYLKDKLPLLYNTIIQQQEHERERVTLVPIRIDPPGTPEPVLTTEQLLLSIDNKLDKLLKLMLSGRN